MIFDQLFVIKYLTDYIIDVYVAKISSWDLFLVTYTSAAGVGDFNKTDGL
jgi:hypothetical protein